jgi:hypothetical protein
MARLKLTFNEEHIKLISNFRTRQVDDEHYAIDTYDLFGGTYLYEDMALILGYMDKVIPGTMEDADGPKFDDETLEHLNELDSFIVENLQNIEDILHQFCTEGIQVGVTYWCNPSECIWHKEEKE